MFKRILFAASPTRASNRAAEMAFALAKQSKAKLHIFHAFGIDSHGWGTVRYLEATGEVDEIKKEIQQFYREGLEKFKVSDYAIDVVAGLPHSEILRFAHRMTPDLIVMSPQETAVETDLPKRWGMTGSCLERVSQKARCPVMVVSENVPKVWTRDVVTDRADFRILVVDDELALRDSLNEWLSDENYTVEMAASGPEALERLAEKTFHLMLTDIKMPGMDGVELLRRAHKAFPDLTVVMMTAYATVDTAVDAMKIGSLDYLTKPFDPEALVDKVFAIYKQFEATRSVQVTFSNIVLATDFSDPADHAFSFAERMLHEHQARLHVFHVLPVSDDQSSLMIDQARIEDEIREAKTLMKQKYCLPSDDEGEYYCEAWEGTPHVEILKFARWKNADLIIMAHHSRETDPEKAFLGSTVVRVALSATCPVVSVNRHPVGRKSAR
jgi:DNA-binding response OmpR family regulator